MSKRNKRSGFVRGGIVGFLLALLIACGPPPQTSSVRVVKMANTQANIVNCGATGGTVLRDPQPPRPASDPGPTILCKYISG